MGCFHFLGAPLADIHPGTAHHCQRASAFLQWLRNDATDGLLLTALHSALHASLPLGRCCGSADLRTHAIGGRYGAEPTANHTAHARAPLSLAQLARGDCHGSLCALGLCDADKPGRTHHSLHPTRCR